MSLSVYHLMPPQLGLILLGLNFESASCCHIRVVRGEAKNQEAADSQGVRQNRGTSNFGALKLRRTEPGINQLCCPIVEEVQGIDRICKSRPSWDGRRSVLATAGGGGRYRQHHHSQVHDLLAPATTSSLGSTAAWQLRVVPSLAAPEHLEQHRSRAGGRSGEATAHLKPL